MNMDFRKQYTVKEMADIVFKDLSERASKEDIAAFTETKQENLVSFHSSLGRSIRNGFKLWEFPWKPEIVDGIDMSDNHPDSISMRVLELVHKKMLGR